MTDDYAPFPYAELLDYADHTPVRALSAHLRNAVKCHEALRERMLLAELELTQLRRDIGFVSMLPRFRVFDVNVS